MEPVARDSADPSQEEATMGLQMQQILQLMSDRVFGKASSEQIEAAVQSLLVDAAVAVPGHQQEEQSSKRSSAAATVSGKNQPEIQVDEEDYDDAEEEEEEAAVSMANASEASVLPLSTTADTSPSLLPPKRKRGRPRKPSTAKFSASNNSNTDWSIYADIPLGKQGAQMLSTFGDGPTPRPETVAACLLGARKMLQVAIQDARYLRRKQSTAYHAAKNAVKPQSVRKSSLTQQQQQNQAGGVEDAFTATTVAPPQNEYTPSMLYRATVGFDRLSSSPPCGFDKEELRLLYPEEMNAYKQWSHFHEEYEQKSKDDGVHDYDQDDKDDVDNDDDKSVDSQPQQALAVSGGHLTERLEQFDIRTDRMKDDWYLQFADLRQGSFLPKNMATRAAQKKAWKEYQSDNIGGAKVGRNRISAVSWANVSLVSARFLHWLGFDMERLPPPNEETTAALAYLAYDFYGRIVEKAIYLRHAAAKKRRRSADETTVLLELRQGEQLEESDIERALDDINPTALYSATAEKKVEPQLYFGPGFEDRLEMEMEELLAGLKEKSLSENEIKARRAEDDLFAKMAEPPAKDGVASLLEEHAEGTRDSTGADTQKATRK